VLHEVRARHTDRTGQHGTAFDSSNTVLCLTDVSTTPEFRAAPAGGVMGRSETRASNARTPTASAMRWTLRVASSPGQPGSSWWKRILTVRFPSFRATVLLVFLIVFSGLSVVSLHPQSRLWAGQWAGRDWPASHPVPGDPISMTTGLYVDSESQPARWAHEHSQDPRRHVIETGIGEMPMGRWFLGSDTDEQEVRTYVRRAAAADKLPIVVAYNIPGRDCGQFSQGGENSPAEYRRWINGLVRAIGSRPALVILEPDALPLLDCRPDPERALTLELLSYAVERFATHAPNTWVYLDAGHSNWMDPYTMADRLVQANVGRARGFSLNVSNYQPSHEVKAYGETVRELLAQRGIDSRFVIDTSRNGKGTAGGEWCNPGGQRIGERPRPGGGNGVDFQLWIKPPGEVDGACGIAPNGQAGHFEPAIAIELLRNTDGGLWMLGLWGNGHWQAAGLGLPGQEHESVGAASGWTDSGG